MPLFTLPDLSKMEVQVMLHETVVDRVRPGMAANVQIDALPGRTLQGRVESINPMPLSDQNPDIGEPDRLLRRPRPAREHPRRPPARHDGRDLHPVQPSARAS